MSIRYVKMAPRMADIISDIISSKYIHIIRLGN